MFARIWIDDAGQDVPEYALMIALILVLTISVIAAIGTDSNVIFSRVANAMESSVAS
ncbi:MAG: hypothetical protein JWN45_422 [Acidobacteriaceae bacterium]|nr:hypothetical protein [Acidobacteriaceae bacterium]